jgi:hypothetical protein
MVFAVSCALVLSAATVSAQPSQGKAGADNGPISNSVTTNGSGQRPTGGVARRHGGRSYGTTGMGRGAAGDLSSERNLGSGSSVPQPQGR